MAISQKCVKQKSLPDTAIKVWRCKTCYCEAFLGKAGAAAQDGHQPKVHLRPFMGAQRTNWQDLAGPGKLTDTPMTGFTWNSGKNVGPRTGASLHLASNQVAEVAMPHWPGGGMSCFHFLLLWTFFNNCQNLDNMTMSSLPSFGKKRNMFSLSSPGPWVPNSAAPSQVQRSEGQYRDLKHKHSQDGRSLNLSDWSSKSNWMNWLLQSRIEAEEQGEGFLFSGASNQTWRTIRLQAKKQRLSLTIEARAQINHHKVQECETRSRFYFLFCPSDPVSHKRIARQHQTVILHINCCWAFAIPPKGAPGQGLVQWHLAKELQLFALDPGAPRGQKLFSKNKNFKGKSKYYASFQLFLIFFLAPKVSHWQWEWKPSQNIMEKTCDRQASLLVVNSFAVLFSSCFLLISILKSGRYLSFLSRLRPPPWKLRSVPIKLQTDGKNVTHNDAPGWKQTKTMGKHTKKQST